MDMDRYIGRLLDNRYEILEVIGTGGMAVVYKARCHRLNRLVAIKILKDEYTQDEEFRRRFHAESQAVAMLSHPNIVSVYDVSTADAADYIVMELIDGITLKQYMEKKGVLNWKETLHFAIQIAKALEHAHSRGIIHRDIKPHNVMVLKNGSVKVADFGIARVMSKSNTLTKEALGSVHYISPEQAKGGRVDNRSDIYSLGVVMYEMMTGRPPYDGESPVAVAIQHINGKAVMPSTLNPNMPGGLEQIIMKAMGHSAADRYSTATKMLFDMDEFRKDPTILFDYNNASTGMEDAAALTARPKQSPVQQPPKNTAERTVAKNESGKTATHQSSDVPKTPARKKRRRYEEVVEEDRGGNWVATVAVVLCALVAVAAICIFIYAMLGDTSVQAMVTVPDLVGQDIESDFVVDQMDVFIKRGEPQYHDRYPAGQIIKQEPEANTQVRKGSTVTVIVSLGPQKNDLHMENLVDLEKDTAVNFLQNVQKIDPERIVITEESNPLDKGKVIRTEPANGEPIGKDQIIRLYISLGPEQKMATMPDVLDKNVEIAKKMMIANGFDESKIIISEVDSPKTKGTVINQSIAPNEKVDATTVVLLWVAKGEEIQPTDPVVPTEPDEGLVYKVVTVPLPENKTEPYVLSIRKNGEIIAQREIPVGTVRTQFELSGEGTIQYEVWIGEVKGWDLTVEFGYLSEPSIPEASTDPTEAGGIGNG